MAVSDLITSIRYQLHDTNTNNYTGAEILDYIQRGHNIVWMELIKAQSDYVRVKVTTALTKSIDYLDFPTLVSPAKIYSFDFLHLCDEDKPLQQVSMEYIDTYDSAAGYQVPTVYAIYDNTIYFRPVPDDNYTIDIYYYPSPNVLTTASNPFDGMADESLIAFAVGMCLNRDEHNVQRNDAVIASLMKMADTMFKRRDKTLKRINAYRWEYQGMV